MKSRRLFRTATGKRDEFVPGRFDIGLGVVGGMNGVDATVAELAGEELRRSLDGHFIVIRAGDTAGTDDCGAKRGHEHESSSAFHQTSDGADAGAYRPINASIRQAVPRLRTARFSGPARRILMRMKLVEEWVDSSD